MSAWGGPRRRVYGIFVPAMLSGVVLLVAGLPPDVTVLSVATFIYFTRIPIMNGCSQAIWLSKTAPDVQGRVFAVRRMIGWSAIPVAYLLAGPLADRVFEPLLADGGRLAGSVGRIIGTGPGRGIGLIFILLGIFSIAVALVGLLHPRVRRVEIEVPDAVVDHPSPTPV
ncbi:MAG TPA: MFS transporter, partial [Chloroflexi bacterium]|nr:MFS transporter [Chloroflexota bacterium]